MWGASSWGVSSWGGGEEPQAEVGIPPLKIGVGTGRAMRIQPASWTTSDGQWVMALGHERPSRKEQFRNGDLFEVVQIGEFTETIVRARGFICGVEVPADSQWVLSLLIDGVERTQRVVHNDPDRERDLFDIAANVAHVAAGSHDIRFRLEFVTSQSGNVEAEIPLVLIDNITFESP